MYICDFSRSVGAGSATTRKTRGLTRSVSALIVPPLPAPSRPSKTMQTLSPLWTTHSWSLTSSTCSFFSAFSYSLLPSGAEALSADFALTSRRRSRLVGRRLGGGRVDPRGAVLLRHACPVAPDYLPAGSTVTATASV
jgi:hypothetical protein